LASWKRPARPSFLDVLASAGALVLASKSPIAGGHSFQDIHLDCSKGTETFALVGCG
jgi:hypothetical protein